MCVFNSLKCIVYNYNFTYNETALKNTTCWSLTYIGCPLGNLIEIIIFVNENPEPCICRNTWLCENQHCKINIFIVGPFPHTLRSLNIKQYKKVDKIYSLFSYLSDQFLFCTKMKLFQNLFSRVSLGPKS